jgi:uncharacterized protein (DUF169 family)
MDPQLKQQFMAKWDKHFPGAELPIVFYYTDDENWSKQAGMGSGTHCVIENMDSVREGKTLVLDLESTKCGGGKRFLGFSQELGRDFEFFLSTGIPGKMEGEHYKKTPALAKEHFTKMPAFEAPGKCLVFKRWDKLEAADEPTGVIFFAKPDVLSGLFSLANFDEPGANGVFAPSGAGCSTIVYYPCVEAKSEHPRAVIGLFDIFARPSIAGSMLTFAVPMRKFVAMVGNMDESFLITEAWGKVKARIKQG